jgi:hypothetical protein
VKCLLHERHTGTQIFSFVTFVLRGSIFVWFSLSELGYYGSSQTHYSMVKMGWQELAYMDVVQFRGKTRNKHASLRSAQDAGRPQTELHLVTFAFLHLQIML